MKKGHGSYHEERNRRYRLGRGIQRKVKNPCQSLRVPHPATGPSSHRNQSVFPDRGCQWKRKRKLKKGATDKGKLDSTWKEGRKSREAIGASLLFYSPS